MFLRLLDRIERTAVVGRSALKNISVLLKNFPFFIEAILLFLFGVIQNSPRLIESSLDYDEILSWEWETGSWANLFYDVFNDTQQILYYVLVKAFLFVAPVNNDYWIRVPSLVLGSAAFLGIFYYVRKNYSWLTAVFFVGMVVFHPLISYVVTYNRPYSLLLFLMGINICLAHSIFIKRNTENKWINWSFFISLVAIGFTHYLGFFYGASLLVGTVVATGFDPIRKFLNSTAMKVAILIALTVLISCFIYQFQYRHRINWIYENQPSLKAALWQTFGIGGVLLGIFFIQLNKFKDRDPTEKFLAVGILVSLLLICSFRIWVDRYMTILLPFSIWLSALYMEKAVNFVRKRGLIVEYSFVALMGGAFLFSPVLADAVFPGMAFGGVSGDFSRPFRLGNSQGVKHLFFTMKEAQLVFPETKVLCVDIPSLAEHPLAQYSKMYWGRDVCTEYTSSFDKDTDLSNYHYIIHIKANANDRFETIQGSNIVSKKNLSLMLVSNSYELFKIDSPN